MILWQAPDESEALRPLRPAGLSAKRAGHGQAPEYNQPTPQVANDGRESVFQGEDPS